jgi:hypothetical protein
LVAIPAFLFLSAVWFRLAIVLPGTAIGRPMTLAEGWKATEGMTGTLIGVAFLFGIFENLADFATDKLLIGSPLIGGLLSFVIYWIVMIVGVAILTTLYGHLVEGREIPA